MTDLIREIKCPLLNQSMSENSNSITAEVFVKFNRHYEPTDVMCPKYKGDEKGKFCVLIPEQDRSCIYSSWKSLENKVKE